MNIDSAMGGNVNFDAKGIKAPGNAMSRKIRAMRMKSSGTMDAGAATDDAMPMDAILREENAKTE